MLDTKRFRAGKQVATGFDKNKLGSGQISSRLYGSVGFKCEYVIVAGGGAGSDRAGGGGRRRLSFFCCGGTYWRWR